MKRFILVIMLISIWVGNSSAAENNFIAAALQFNPILNERDKNIDALAQAVEEAAQNGAKLIVAPEMSTTGYQYIDREAIAPYVDTLPGVATAKIGAVAKKYGIYVVFGLAEGDPETGLFYNSAALVGPEGYIGKYRKSHPVEPDEYWAAWGDIGVPVFDTEIGKIAINICMDSAFFEPSRLAAVAGADIIAFPTNSTVQALWGLQARAVQNGLYIVAANRSNTELDYHMIGGSAIWSPTDKLLASAAVLRTKSEDVNEATAIYSEIDVAQYNNANKKHMAERRPELYKELALHIVPSNAKATQHTKDISASVVQYIPVQNNKSANMNKIKNLLMERTMQQLDIIVLPEFSLTGKPHSAIEAEMLAETADGRSVNFYKNLATAHESYVVGSVIERANGKLFLSAYLFAPDGTIAGKYRKTHLTLEEKAYASAGDSIGVYDSKIGKIGIMFGNESQFPEIAGVLAIKRADIIAVPASFNGEYGAPIYAETYNLPQNRYPSSAMCLFDSIALSAQAYTLVANFTGDAYQGGSGKYAMDPLYGLDYVELLGSKEQVLCVRFDTLQNEWWFNQRNMLIGRNPILYKPIVSAAK